MIRIDRQPHSGARTVPAPKPTKNLVVLDTSVLLHDPTALFRFKEHDIILLRIVFTQLDSKKSGHTDVARNARQVTRNLDTIFRGDRKRMQDGASLAEISNGAATGKLFFQMETLSFPIPEDLLRDDADRNIIAATCALRRERTEYTKVTLVTKDKNMFYAALAVKNSGIAVEDYRNDKVLLKDADVLPTGFHMLPPDFWETNYTVTSWTKDAHSFWRFRGPICNEVWVNECVYLDGDQPFSAKVIERSDTEILLESLTDYQNGKSTVWGIHARNREQNFALNHLMDPNIDLTILLGEAGTGKSMCTVAAALEYWSRRTKTNGIEQIIATRAMVPVEGEELGFLPGTVEEKFGPWMLALEDTKSALFRNAKKIKQQGEADSIAQYRGDIKIQPIAFIAGRTLSHSYVIVDEAQELTPNQAKMLVTRAGEGTKFIFCGNLSQIQNQFLDEKSSGLAYLVMRMRGDRRVAHVILQECVRSPLAELGVKRL